MLRAIGMSRRQVRTMIRYEAVITALIGADPRHGPGRDLRGADRAAAEGRRLHALLPGRLADRAADLRGARRRAGGDRCRPAAPRASTCSSRSSTSRRAALSRRRGARRPIRRAPAASSIAAARAAATAVRLAKPWIRPRVAAQRDLDAGLAHPQPRTPRPRRAAGRSRRWRRRRGAGRRGRARAGPRRAGRSPSRCRAGRRARSVHVGLVSMKPSAKSAREGVAPTASVAG